MKVGGLEFGREIYVVKKCETTSADVGQRIAITSVISQQWLTTIFNALYTNRMRTGT